jgi:uncharacterized membrane protein (DUF485 family)
MYAITFLHVSDPNPVFSEAPTTAILFGFSSFLMSIAFSVPYTKQAATHGGLP